MIKYTPRYQVYFAYKEDGHFFVDSISVDAINMARAMSVAKTAAREKHNVVGLFSVHPPYVEDEVWCYCGGKYANYNPETGRLY